MKHFLRLVSATVTVSVTVLAPATVAASGNGQLSAFFNDSPALFVNSSSGYLGVGFRDVDTDRAAALKLKEPAGVEILTIDHDAPANAVGLKLHDVILQMNGQPVAGAEQLRRMLRETPPGRSVSLVISRDGQQQTLNVTLADHDQLEKKAGTGLFLVPDPNDDGSIALVPPSSHSGGNGFFGSLTFGNTSVGVQLDTLGSQLADYFGVKDGQGLLVKHVAENSPAATAGLKAGDVVLKVNNQVMATLNDWTRTMHTNRGKQVQVVIIRNRQQQTLSMQDGDAKHKGELLLPQDLFDENDRARLNAELSQLGTIQLPDTKDLLDAQKLAGQASKMASQIDAGKLQLELQQSLQGFDLQKLQHQMEEMQKNLQSLEMY